MQPKRYREAKALSQSLLKDARSPRKFEARYITGTMEREPTQAMDLGSLVDCMLLTPGELAQYFVQIPDDVLTSNGQKRGKKWEAFEAEHEGKTLMKRIDFVLAATLVQKVKSHPIWPRIVEAGFETQKEVYWTDPASQFPAKALVDIFPTDPAKQWLIDLKTTGDMDDFEGEHNHLFACEDDEERVVRSKSVFNYGYHTQGAWYLRGASTAFERMFTTFILLVVETSAPYRVKTFRIADDALLAGQAFIDRATQALAARMIANDWSEPGENEIIEISLPNWAFK